MRYLVVVRPFSTYRIGDVVTDEQSIEKILLSENAENVVRINPPSED